MVSTTPATLEPMFFFFNDTATTEIYTLSLHDALPIYAGAALIRMQDWKAAVDVLEAFRTTFPENKLRSEEHTSELQSQSNLVCRLLLEKKSGLSLLCTRRAVISHESFRATADDVAVFV